MSTDAMEYSAKEIVAMVEKHRGEISTLRTKWEDNYDLFTQAAYAESIKKGESENVTSNSAAVLGERVMEYLADATLKFHVALQMKETEKSQSKGSSNELFVIAMNALSEEKWQQYPQHQSLQSESAFYATVFGSLARRVYLWEDKGEVIADVAEWAILNTNWGTGYKGLDWASYKRLASPKEIEDCYGKKFDPESDGWLRVYDWWGTNVEKVICRDEEIYSNKHDLGYVPVFIKGVGAIPVILSERHADTIKHWGPSIYELNRSMYPLENKIATYYLTAVDKGINTPKVLWTVGAAPADNPFSADPYKKGVIVLDSTKFKSIEDFIKPVVPQEAAFFLNWVMGKEREGGVPPILHGDSERMQTLGGLNLLNHNALMTLKPRKKGMEQEYTWTAKEFLNQYINGKFKEMEVSGFDSRQKQYALSTSPDKLDPKQRVMAEFMLNLPMDEYQNAGIVASLVESGIYTKKRAMNKLGVEDAEAELEQLAIEKIRQIPQIQLPVIAAELIKRGETNWAKAVLTYIESQGMGEQQQKISAGGVARPANPQQMIRNPSKDVMAELNQKARLARIGLEQG